MEIKLNYKQPAPSWNAEHRRNIATVDLVIIMPVPEFCEAQVEVRVQSQSLTNIEIARGREPIHFEKKTDNVILPLRQWAFSEHNEMPDRRDIVSLLETTVASALIAELAASISTFDTIDEFGYTTSHPVLKFNARPALLELESLLTHCRMEDNNDEQ